MGGLSLGGQRLLDSIPGGRRGKLLKRRGGRGRLARKLKSRKKGVTVLAYPPNYPNVPGDGATPP
jgi:hypothetical protein